MTIINPLPFTIANGQSIDAGPVTANFNEIYNDTNANAAHNGTNSDITSLNALSTAITVSQGGTGNGTGQGLQDGGCSIGFTSGTVVTLSPLDGGDLFINNIHQTVTAGGVALSSTGGVIGGGNVVAGTLYYIYAYMVGTVMTLGASTTGSTLDTAGRLNMSTDVTKRLVGMTVPTTGTPGIFTQAQTRSFFHDNGLISTTVSISASSASTTPVVGGTINALLWANENFSVSFAGSVAQNVSPAHNNLTEIFFVSTALASFNTSISIISVPYNASCSSPGTNISGSDGLKAVTFQIAADATAVYTATWTGLFALNSAGLKR